MSAAIGGHLLEVGLVGLAYAAIYGGQRGRPDLVKVA